jgi:hypothetical protein
MRAPRDVPPTHRCVQSMDRNKQILVLLGVAVAAFLLGFLPQWLRADRYRGQLDDARHELRVSRQQDAVGAALTEALRSNYERSRQLMTGFFSEVQTIVPRTDDPARQRELQAILAQRDEIITLLARAAPESAQRLMLIHTSYYRAMNPAGATVPAATTPSPQPPAPEADTTR